MTNNDPPPPSQPAPSFEESLAHLEQIVGDLEEGRLGLEASLVRFEEGVRLLRNCQSLLETAERKIEILTSSPAAAQLETRPFDAEATFTESAAPPAAKPTRRKTTKSDPAGEEGESRLF
jgi:exodeoxyribonuclease VII small subunit